MHLPTSPLVATLLVTVAVLGGCSLPLEDEPPTDRTTEATPVVVPENGSANGIGLNETGVTDPSRLASTHVDALAPPYVINEIWVMKAGDERLLRYEARRVVDRTGVAEVRIANGSATGVLLTDRREATSLEEHRFNTRLQTGVDRAVDGEETSMHWWEASETLEIPVMTNDFRLLESIFSFVRSHSSDDSYAQSGNHLLTGWTSEPEDPIVAPWVMDPENAIATASVTKDGFVCSVELRYRAEYEERSLIISYQVQYVAGPGPDRADGDSCE